MAEIVCSSDNCARSVLEALAGCGLPPQANVIYRGRNIVAELDGMCIKAFAVPGVARGLIYTHLREPKAKRAYDNAQRLLSMGIDTPAPLGYVVNTDRGILKESYYVCRMLEGYSELRGIEKRCDFDSLVTSLARFMLKLHRKGVYFKDFTQGNVLFRKIGAGYEFALVDINRMEFGITDRRRLYENFGSTLDTEAGQQVLARRYAEVAGDPSLADELMEIYCRRQIKLWRKRRIKEKVKKLLGKIK